jgi:malonate-semialdehyde dehydrogenase (acetylating)/methylmalonate-semialdehyde dehydrogenase
LALVTELVDAPPALKPIHHWIGGKRHEGTSGRSGAVYNPATGAQTGTVDFASVAEIDAAVQAAKAAAPEWRALSIGRRAELFFRIRELFDAHREDLARLLTAEHGKVLSDAMGEVARGLEVIEFCCGLPTLLKGGFSEQASTGVDVYSIRQPLGVVAGITPFNFPAMVPMWMWAPALACGNTFILKPSEKDPSASVLTAELLAEVGVPPGVFNVVHGDKVAVDALLEHPDISAISFVGSTPIAKYVYEKATAGGKRCQALGGAKNHMIVLPDADLDMAADAAVSAGYGSAGERCMAVSMLVAVGGVADELVGKIKERIPKVKVADGLEPDAEMGPLVTREHRDRVASYVENAPGEGATVVVDGRETAPEGDGFFLGPSLIDNVTPEMANYRDEIFGPVLGVTRVDTYDEAINLVNSNPYGNGTAIFTRDGGVARQFQFDVQAGMVGVNVPIPVPVAYYSFGGWKASLFGDHHIYGRDGVHFYTRTKAVTSRWPDPRHRGVDLGFPQNK